MKRNLLMFPFRKNFLDYYGYQKDPKAGQLCYSGMPTAAGTELQFPDPNY